MTNSLLDLFPRDGGGMRRRERLTWISVDIPWIQTCTVGGGSGALVAGAAGASGGQGGGADAGDVVGGGEVAHMQAGGAAVEGHEVSEGDGLECSGAVSQVSVYCPCILVDILR